MTSTAIWCGRLLVLVGIIGYGYGMANNNASLTALIPSVFGFVIMLLGHGGNMMENMRKHFMHVALLVALIGFLIPAWRIVASLGGDKGFTFTTAMLLSMALICLLFLVFGVRSFINARSGS